jgi:hypothetical protein
MLLVKDLEWTKEIRMGGEDTIFFAHTDLGRFSVLDRLTGYGFGIRDIETGYRDLDGKFWLASNGFDIRDDELLTIKQAIAKVKKYANTCSGA